MKRISFIIKIIIGYLFFLSIYLNILNYIYYNYSDAIILLTEIGCLTFGIIVCKKYFSSDSIYIKVLAIFTGIPMILVVLILWICDKITNKNTSKNENSSKTFVTNNSKIFNQNKNITENNNNDDFLDDEVYYDECDDDTAYYCERCFKKISEEEYDLNEGLCEECRDDIIYEHKIHDHFNEHKDHK